jgi:hypothetical protein
MDTRIISLKLLPVTANSVITLFTFSDYQELGGTFSAGMSFNIWRELKEPFDEVDICKV